MSNRGPAASPRPFKNDARPSRMPIRAKACRGAMVTPHALQQSLLMHYMMLTPTCVSTPDRTNIFIFSEVNPAKCEDFSCEEFPFLVSFDDYGSGRC